VAKSLLAKRFALIVGLPASSAKTRPGAVAAFAGDFQFQNSLLAFGHS
jgi:hypothetical protein